MWEASDKKLHTSVPHFPPNPEVSLVEWRNIVRFCSLSERVNDTNSDIRRHDRL